MINAFTLFIGMFTLFIAGSLTLLEQSILFFFLALISLALSVPILIFFKKIKFFLLAILLIFSFSVPGEIIFFYDFISITKIENIEWQELKPLILSQIMQHYMSGESIIEEIKEDISVELSEEDKEIVTQIEDLLETRVRPSVASHGGDIVFHSYSEGIVELEMRGACSGCPSSTLTLKF